MSFSPETHELWYVHGWRELHHDVSHLHDVLAICDKSGYQAWEHCVCCAEPKTDLIAPAPSIQARLPWLKYDAATSGLQRLNESGLRPVDWALLGEGHLSERVRTAVLAAQIFVQAQFRARNTP